MTRRPEKTATQWICLIVAALLIALEWTVVGFETAAERALLFALGWAVAWRDKP